ncbi:molybdenum cofactor biosynthesis protein MoeC [Streptomyces spiroverticillatus]|uniref:Molybdenum cofactor biosynthesis protein MoeC n=1 Tax=Streptomyces finlayi TaxID=67296 RepID=A0A918X9L0_9ACTN|nr:MaoC family dehydratase [Streptomyces finlayi]GHA50941.1 molybdenum cofactor biosynthesis protein MoeC [Streptomyces spiroverticillatus]GHD20034.1 molybdenum cofactor biosynthesis protein MoeC [Streptomyces finlayi]
MTGTLPQGYRRTAANRIRENVGWGYDDFITGRIIEHRPARTVTETDNLLGTALAGNTAPIHTDAHYAATTRWGQILVCGGVTLNLVAGMTVRSTSGLTLANLTLDDVRFTHPVFVGDTLYAETEIVGRRRSESRPDQGLVTCRTRGHNQDHTLVVTFTRTFLVPTDPDAVRDATGY